MNGQPSWPIIQPDPDRIDAALAGYCQHGSLSGVGMAALSDAIAFAECYHNARQLPVAIQGDWKQNRSLVRFHQRYKVVPILAENALRVLASMHNHDLKPDGSIIDRSVLEICLVKHFHALQS